MSPIGLQIVAVAIKREVRDDVLDIIHEIVKAKSFQGKRLVRTS